jgi:MYXO-CTERM domain-containing protein
MRPRWLALSFAASLVALSGDDAAEACTTTDDIYLVEPKSGAVGVPTNVEVWLVGGVGSPAQSLTLEGDDGVRVPYTVRPLPEGSWRMGASLLRPDAPLRPRARYTLKAQRVALPEAIRAWTFVTGDGPAAGTPEAIRVDATQAVDNARRSSCGYSSSACVGLSYRGAVDVVLRRRCDGRQIDHYLVATTEHGLHLPYDGWLVREPICAELRARRADGALGPAARFCTDPAATAVVIAGCPLTCANGVALLDDHPVALPPDDLTPASCLEGVGLTPELVERIRAEVGAMRVPADGPCAVPDGGAADVAAVVDDVPAAVDAAPAEVDAGGVADAAPPTPALVVDAGCGCRAAPPPRASAWWIAALALFVRRRATATTRR